MNRRLATVLSVRLDPVPGEHGAEASPDAVASAIAFVETIIPESGGCIVRTVGRGITAEYASVVTAVQSALDMRDRVEGRNQSLPANGAMSISIGIDLWDVVVDNNDVSHESALIASRLQESAEPGDILISETVYQHVRQHLPLTFEDAGRRLLKDNFTLIPTFYVKRNATAPAHRSRSANTYQASVAVLPFSNAGGDPEQNYLGDGLAEEIINYLSRQSPIYVVPVSKAFSYRGTSLTLGQLAVELGVQFILRGSVRADRGGVKLSVQLDDGHINTTLLTKVYQRSPDQIMELKDIVSHDVLCALEVKFLVDHPARQSYAAEFDAEAYRFYLMGRSYFRSSHTKRLLRLAKQMFQRALDREPDFAAAHAGIADCDAFLLEAGDLTIPVDQILGHSKRALELDDSLAGAHASMGLALYARCQYSEAEESFERAIALQPDLFEAYYFFGRNCLNQGQFSRAADLFGEASKLRRDDFRSLGLQSMCYLSLSQMTDARNAARAALARAERAVGERPDDADALSFGAGLLAFLGEYSRTKAWAERAAVIAPDDYYAQYNIACAYAVIGERETAINKLMSIMNKSTPESRIEYMLQDSDLDTLRDHPLYKKWIVSLLG